VDQAEGLEDVLAAIPQGLGKRPPFQYLGTLQNHPGSATGVFHYVERSAGAALFTLTREAAVTVPRVYDLATLALQALTIDAATQTYVNAGVTTPQHDLGCQTVADFTFAWNRTQNVANSNATAASRPNEALIWVRGGAYAKDYKVVVSGAGTQTVTLHTPDGTSASDGTYVDTEKIAAALVSGSGYTASNGATLTGNLTALTGSGFTVSRIGPVIYLSHANAFEVAVTDGQGGAAMVAAKGKVQKFSDLPQKAPDGFTVRIVQTSGTDADDFYVHFVKTAGDGTGIWEECIAPGALLGLDKNTMPMGLVNDSGWKFKVLDWKQRATGNEELVPDPDFIGQPVQDLTFWQGRLGVISGEGVTLSCADDPFQLYPRTLSSVLDSDPIGRVNPAPGETTYRYALPFEGRMVLCGDTIQTEVTEDGILTPLKARIDTMTQHELNRYIRPSAVNGKLYFSTPRGATASGIHEISIDRVTNVPVGEDLTTAAFRYLPPGVDRSAVCPVLYLACYGVSGSGDIYVHLFRHSDQERVQNAFERWHLPTGYTLGGMFFVNTSLYLLACKGGKGYVLKCDLSPLVFDADVASTIQTYLDFKASEAQCTIVYDAVTDTSTITLPYDRAPETALVIRAPGATDLPEGYVPTLTNGAASTDIIVAGNYTAVPFYVGHKYASKWHLTRIYPLDANKHPLRNGRCQLRKITLDLSNTGYIRAEVTAGGRPTYSYEYFGFTWDDPAARFDIAPSATTRWPFPVMAENEQVEIQLINDSPFGYNILGMEWVGEFNPRSQRT
jgi:hypothetical protein